MCPVKNECDVQAIDIDLFALELPITVVFNLILAIEVAMDPLLSNMFEYITIFYS